MRISLFSLIFWLCCGLFSFVSADSNGSEKEQKLLNLESQISALESKTFDLRQKINTISNKIFKGKFNSSNKAHLSVIHQSSLGGAFKVKQVTYWLDSKKIFSTQETSDQPIPERKVIFKHTSTPGKHTLKVVAKVRGHGYNIFTYMKKYHLELSSELNFELYRGRLTEIRTEFVDTGVKNLRKRLKLVFRKKFQR